MAFDTLHIPFHTDVAADLQAAVTALVGRIQAYGWVQTTDTGQATAATIAAFSGNYILGGYFVFKMGDTLQATAPLFLRLDIVSGRDASATGLGYGIQVGTATDGAGNITGQHTIPYFMMPPAYTVPASGTTFISYTSGSTNRFAMSLAQDGSFHLNNMFSVERTKDATGADTAAGALILIATDNADGAAMSRSVRWSAYGPQTIYLDSTAGPTVLYGWRAAAPLSPGATPTGTMAGGTTVGVGVPYHFGPDPKNPGLNGLVYMGSNFAPGSLTSITLYTTAGNYVALYPDGYVLPQIENGYNSRQNNWSAVVDGHALMRAN